MTESSPPSLLYRSPSQIAAKKDYWLLAVTQLKHDEPKLAEALDGMSKAAVVGGGDIADNAVSATNRNKERLVEKRWQIQFRSRTIKIRDQLDKILIILKAVKDVGSAAAGLDPIHAGLPWAGICLLMQLTLNDSEQYAAMVSDTEEVASIISRYRYIPPSRLPLFEAKSKTQALEFREPVESLYLRDDDLSFQKAFEKHLITLYIHILKFEVLAARYYQKNTISRWVSSIPKLDDSSGILADIRKQDSTCKEFGQIFTSKDAHRKHQEILTVFKTHDELVEVMIKEMREQETINARILNWISDLPFDTTHRLLKTKLGDDYQQSGKWLLVSNPEFQAWRHSLSAPALFWLHGRVGTGKSSVAYLTIEYLSRHKLLDERIAFFYCVRSEGERTKPDDILRSILRQVSWSSVAMSVAPVVKSLYQDDMQESPGSTHSALTLSEILGHLKEIILSAPYVKVVIDALDECSNYRLLLKSLMQLWTIFPDKFRVFVTSRESSDIGQLVRDASGFDVDNSNNVRDVEDFVGKELDRRAEDFLGGGSKDLLERLRQLLISHAHGMFKWVELQLAIFLDQESGLVDRWDVIEKLGELEANVSLPNLNTVYDEIYNRNTKGKHSRTVANRAFKWMMCLFREHEPLSHFNAKALAFAVSIEGDGTLDPTINQDYILRICSNLLVLDPIADRFRYAHLSVLEYLAQRYLNDTPTDGFDSQDVHAQVAESCLSFLNRQESLSFADHQHYDQYHQYSWENRTGDFFALYAFFFWPFHCALAETKRCEGSLQRIFSCFVWNNSDASIRINQWSEGLNMNLHYATNITSDTSRTYLRNLICPKGSLFFLACAFGFLDVVEGLGKSKRKDMNLLNSSGHTGLDIASTMGHEGVVRSLIYHGADIEATSAQDNTRCTALVHACEHGRINIVRILLDAGAKVNEKTNFNFTPKTALHAAVENGYENIVSLLLEAGANPNAVCRVGMWANREDYKQRDEDHEDLSDFEHAIHYAWKAAEGHCFSRDQLAHRESVVRELVHEKQNTWDDLAFVLSSRWAPIHFAACRREMGIMRSLLDHGADINAGAGHGETALHMAIDIEALALVRWMLNQGADLTARSRSYSTPLMNASKIGHESTFRLLMGAKAKDSSWGRDLGETLVLAVSDELETGSQMEACVRRDEGDEDERSNFAKREAIIRLLLEKGADIETAALHVDLRRMTGAANFWELDCYQMFGSESSNGALEIPGVRPLYVAAVLGHLQMIQLLIELGANVNAKDDGTQMPALYEAASRGHEEVVKQLLAALADPSIKGGKHGSILAAAKENGRDAVVQLLIENGAREEHVHGISSADV